jgi:glutamate-ammonia-ligase adenylyltransferase
VEPDVRERFGLPQCRYVLLGLGKLGGREISYHSDLDLLLVYEGEGTTRGGAEPTSNSYYFTELTQRVIKVMSRMGPMGRLYAVDMRLRPTGKSGSLVLPLCEFDRYFATDAAQLWERQSLSRARVVRGEAAFAERVTSAIHKAMLRGEWEPKRADEMRAMRQKLEATAPPRSLKRGPGGIVDVEFLVQLFQLKFGRERPELLRSNVWDALDGLEAAALLASSEAGELRSGYSFLRTVEARLRIVTDRPLTEVPEGAGDLAKLARRLAFEPAPDASPADRFLGELRSVSGGIRRLYDAITKRERAS